MICTWKDGADLTAGETTVDHHGEKRTTRESLGWKDALAAYRPFLSYSELGTLLEEGPARLHDALRTGLGVEGLGVVERRLAEHRKRLEALEKDEKAVVLAHRRARQRRR